MPPPRVSAPATLAPPVRLAVAAVWVTVCGVSAGCGSEASIRRGDIRTYTAPRPTAPAIASTARAGRDPAPPAARRLQYELPAGWAEGAGAGGMRLATVTIGDPTEGREVTVIPASGSLRSNIERWHKQLAGDEEATATTAAVDRALADAETVDVDGAGATVVLLLGSPGADDGKGEAILGAMVPLDDTSALFVKFKGAADVALRERANFTRFVSSLRWD